VRSAEDLSVNAAEGVTLACERSGAGAPVLLLHGLTATRRYVTMGSTELQRSGYCVIAYDARGHGRSDPARSSRAYTYEHLGADLRAILDWLALPRAVIAGVSMGAHTAIRMALAGRERVAALGLITPAYDPQTWTRTDFSSWDSLAKGLREGGAEGFLSAYDFSQVPEVWRPTLERVIRQRLAEHAHPGAVADALEVVPRSRPFEHSEDLGRLTMPTVIVASRDEADPEHPLAVGERYARAIPRARLVVEDPPPPLRSPIAWQGGRVSKVLAELAAAAGWPSGTNAVDL
jgi:pimeloyl-ACP methyl ester carboxylesterase